MALRRKGDKARRKQLDPLQKAARLAAHCYRRAGIRVYSLIRQMEAKKLATQARE